MTKKQYLFAAIFIGIMIAVCGALVLMQGFFKSAKREISAQTPDVIAVATLPNGNRMVNDKTGGYSFVVPARWYLEKKDGAGVAVYPNYVPDGTVPPKCKIEISVFENIPAARMNDWVTDHIHEDPTVAVVEKSRNGFSASGTQNAFVWKGTIDGIETTLGYIAANGNVYEIAPSAFNIASADGNVACNDSFQSLLKTINFTKNAE